MSRKRSWSDDELLIAVRDSLSVRMVIGKLGLIPAGGNYTQVNKRIELLGIDKSHFTGMGWHTGSRVRATVPAIPLDKLLVKNSDVQSYKLKSRLFKAGIKEPKCELCGWEQRSLDGRIPVELDHINGNHVDNRLDNLRILCPNCHSLQSTHRGRNKKVGLSKLAK